MHYMIPMGLIEPLHVPNSVQLPPTMEDDKTPSLPRYTDDKTLMYDKTVIKLSAVRYRICVR